jgi:hypothetical protein
MRKQCKRKIWATNINPVAHAIAGAAITTQDVLNKLRMAEYSALDTIIHGEGTKEHWQILANLLNVAQCMATDGIGLEVLPCCDKVQQALIKAAEYYGKTNRMVFNAEGIKAIRELIEYADLQQKSISRAEFERYIEKTRNKIKSGHMDVYEIS